MLGIGRPIFDKSEKIALCTPRRPKGPPRDPRGIPEGSPRDPRGTPEGPNGVPKGPKCSTTKPNWAPKSPKAPQSQSKGNQNKPRGQTIYQKTPDQPPARKTSKEWVKQMYEQIACHISLKVVGRSCGLPDAFWTGLEEPWKIGKCEVSRPQ